MMKRIPIGIKGFDKLIEGGFPENSAIVVLGSYGSGKTIFGLEYIYNGALNGDSCIYISFEQNSAMIRIQAEQMNLKKWSVLEKKGKISFMYIPCDEVNKKTISDIVKKIQNKKATRVVIDSLSALSINAPIYSLAQKIIYKEIGTMKNPIISSAINDSDLKKNFIYHFIKELKKLGTTSLLLTEVENGLSVDKVSEYVADGVVQLSLDTLGSEVSRNLCVKKMRNTNNKLDVVPFEIGKKGLVIKKVS